MFFWRIKIILTSQFMQHFSLKTRCVFFLPHKTHCAMYQRSFRACTLLLRWHCLALFFSFFSSPPPSVNNWNRVKLTTRLDPNSQCACAHTCASFSLYKNMWTHTSILWSIDLTMVKNYTECLKISMSLENTVSVILLWDDKTFSSYLH